MTEIDISSDIVAANGCAKGNVEARRRQDKTLIHSDSINIASARSRRQFGKAVADALHDPDALGRVERLLLAHLEEVRSAPPPTAPSEPTSEELLKEMPQAVRDAAEKMLAEPELMRLILADVRKLGVVGDRRVVAAIYLVGTSRLLDRPLGAISRGATASGKSFTINQTAKLFPPETVIQAHRMTPNALFYMPENALVHKFVIGGERARQQDDEQADASKALREMLSDGFLTLLVPMKIGDEMQTVRIRRPGPIAYVESTSAANVFAEDLNRCLELRIDESPEQTRRIVQAAAADAAGGGIDPQTIVPAHHALQRMLKPYRVLVPYAGALGDVFPVDKVEARRAMSHLLNTIKALALLYQRQRQTQGDDTVIATRDDYAMAIWTLRDTLARLAGGIDQGVRRVYDAITKRVGDDADYLFTRQVVAGWCGMSQSDANGRLRVLCDYGLVVERIPHRGNQPAKYVINQQADLTVLEVGVKLPKPEELP